jgi:hypothetical protein
MGAVLGALVCACSPAAAPPVVEVPLDVPRLDGGAPASATAGIRFGREPFRVGTRWSTSIRAESVTQDTTGGEQASAYVSEYSVEVLAVDGGAPSQVHVRFERNQNEYQGVPRGTSIDGKIYLVDAAGPSVRDPSGSAVSSDEVTRVLDVFPDLGTRMRVDEVLPDDPMKIGDRRDDLAGAILRVLHPRAWKLVSGHAALARVEGAMAVFAVDLDATSTSRLRMKVEGEAQVRLRDAWLMNLDLRGSYAHEGSADVPGSFSVQRRVRDS